MTTHQAARRAAQAIYDANESNPSITLTAQGMATVIEQEYAPIVEAAKGLREALMCVPTTTAAVRAWEKEMMQPALTAAKEAGI